MEEENENPEDSILLPYDVLVFLAKYFTKRDGLAVALSGVLSETFAAIHGDNRICSIKQCFFLTVSRWNTFFQKHINPLTLTSFSATSCYWLPSKVLVDSIVQMQNLEELDVLDTQIFLQHMPEIFVNCPEIKRLGLSLAGLISLDKFQQEFKTKEDKIALECMLQCFKKLTHLKLFNFDATRLSESNPNDCISAWPVLLDVLSLCRDCIDLRIDVSGEEKSIRYQKISSSTERELFHKYFGRLRWMSSLESLIVNRECPFLNPTDSSSYISLFYSLIYQTFDSAGRAVALKRLWLNICAHDSIQLYNNFHSVPFGQLFSVPSVESFCVKVKRFSFIDVNDQRFNRLQHYGDFEFTRLAELPHLKYAAGGLSNSENIQGFNDFCESHPLLEYLHVETFYNLFWRSALPLGNWRLLKLKGLVYHPFGSPCKEIMDHLIKACPNILSLHVGRSYRVFGDNVNFLSAIRFHNLRSLSLHNLPLSDGSFIPSVLEQCPKLESLQLSGTCIPGVVLAQIGQCLPTATNLRDFRFAWWSDEKVADILLLLTNLLKYSSHLQRLVLSDFKHSNPSSQLKWNSHLGIEDFLFDFISKMDNLVALCLTGFSINPKAICEVNRRVAEEIRPERPSFWFHLGYDAIGANDLTVPRIHYKLVNPDNRFYAAPPTN